MLPTMSLDDHRTLQAIGILADVLDEVSGAGVLDTVLVSKALRQVLVTKSRPAFDFASRAFSTLDPEVKRQVAVDAGVKARAQAGQTVQIRPAAAVRKPEEAPARKPVQTPPSATGLLSALNSRGRTPNRRPGGEGGGA